MVRSRMNPTRAALTGALLAVPFVAMNAIVANRIEPFFSFIRPGIHTSRFEYVALFSVVLLIPVGAFIAARPMLQRGVDGRRRFHAINAILAALLCMAFVAVVVGLGTDIYRCDVLGIPNCD
jgi:hypothetical protein